MYHIVNSLYILYSILQIKKSSLRIINYSEEIYMNLTSA